MGILVDAFIRSFCKKGGRDPLDLPPQCIRKLRAYSWPGNVRELQNVIERAVILSRGKMLSLDGILPPAPAVAIPEPAFRSNDTTSERAAPRTDSELRQMERVNIMQALEQTGWKISGESGAARLLGLAPSTLTSRMKSLGIHRPR